MATLLSLTKDRDDARRALASAGTNKERAKAASALEAATTELALFNAKLKAKAAARVRSEDAEDEGAEEDADDADDEPKGKSSDDDDDDDDDDMDEEDADDDEDASDDDDDSDEEESDDEDEEARASAIASARSVLSSAKKAGNKSLIASARASLEATRRAIKPKAIANYRTLLSACQRVTSKRSMQAVLGALEGLSASAKSTEKLSADLARLKSSQRRDKVDSLLSSARRDGKVTKEETKALRADGMKQGTKWLRAHLGARPKLVRSVAEGASEGRTLEGGKDGDVTRATALDAQNLSEDQRKIVETMAAAAGKSFDDFFAEMGKTRARADARRPS